MDLAEAITALRAAANVDDAGPMAAYMRHVAPFLGVKTPARRAATREFIAEVRKSALPPDAVLAAMDALFALPEREFAYLGVDLLGARIEGFGWDGIVQGVVPFLDRNPWWDTVDALQGPVGRWVRGRREYLRPLVEHLLAGTMWRRRVAITMQLGWREATDQALLTQAIRANLADEEFFIRKAIGWALRDYARTDPDWVREFLDAEGIEGLARREAAKHLTI
ncbi:MAG: DNA alkylation repair protein [Bifidobacteriaceae bacterium]|jgi:3-methyladenine DNA glycosylase AlkD|nr:DNA alkylation repair protein [Bifidobacteriaceae bacterium]